MASCIFYMWFHPGICAHLVPDHPDRLLCGDQDRRRQYQQKPNAFIYCLALSTHASFYSYSNTIISSLIMSMRWVYQYQTLEYHPPIGLFLSHIPEPELCGEVYRGNIKAERPAYLFQFCHDVPAVGGRPIEKGQQSFAPVEGLQPCDHLPGFFHWLSQVLWGFQKPWWLIQQAYLLMPSIITTFIGSMLWLGPFYSPSRYA